MGPALGWLVLTLVFVDELLCIAAAWVWGDYTGGWPVAVLAAASVVAVWATFASPKAPYGGGGVRPTVKVLVFGLAALGLAVAGHLGLAVGLVVFSAVVNAVAQLPSVRTLSRQP